MANSPIAGLVVKYPRYYDELVEPSRCLIIANLWLRVVLVLVSDFRTVPSSFMFDKEIACLE